MWSWKRELRKETICSTGHFLVYMYVITSLQPGLSSASTEGCAGCLFTRIPLIEWGKLWDPPLPYPFSSIYWWLSTILLGKPQPEARGVCQLGAQRGPINWREGSCGINLTLIQHLPSLDLSPGWTTALEISWLWSSPYNDSLTQHSLYYNQLFMLLPFSPCFPSFSCVFPPRR